MSIKQTHELKQLQTRLANATAQHKEAKKLAIEAQRKESELQRQRNLLQMQIEELTREPPEPVVTEHALLRYFERVLGYNLKTIRDGLLTPEVRGYMRQFPSGKVPSIGCRLIVKDGTVVTIEADKPAD